MAKFYGVTNAVIDGNTYIGKGAGDHLDYGIELSAGAVASITNNKISNCLGVAGDGSTSAAIQITTYFGAGPQGTILNNILRTIRTHRSRVRRCRHLPGRSAWQFTGWQSVWNQEYLCQSDQCHRQHVGRY